MRAGTLSVFLTCPAAAWTWSGACCLFGINGYLLEGSIRFEVCPCHNWLESRSSGLHRSTPAIHSTLGRKTGGVGWGRKGRAGGEKGREKEGRRQTAFLQNTLGQVGSPGRLCFPLRALPKAGGRRVSRLFSTWLREAHVCLKQTKIFT